MLSTALNTVYPVSSQMTCDACMEMGYTIITEIADQEMGTRAEIRPHGTN